MTTQAPVWDFQCLAAPPSVDGIRLQPRLGGGGIKGVTRRDVITRGRRHCRDADRPVASRQIVSL